MARVQKLKKNVPLICLYRCESCGQIVSTRTAMNYLVIYEERGLFSQGRNAGKRAQALAGFEEDARDCLAQLENAVDRDNSVFGKAGLKCRCPHCGRRQSWTRVNTDNLEAGFYAALTAAILLLFFRGALSVWTISAAAAAIALYAAKLLVRRRMLGRVGELSKTAPPLFARDAEALRREALPYPAYADFDWPQAEPDAQDGEMPGTDV